MAKELTDWCNAMKMGEDRVKTGIEISAQFTLIATQRELDRVIFGGKCVNNIVVS